jgi:hypothetical protein
MRRGICPKHSQIPKNKKMAKPFIEKGHQFEPGTDQEDVLRQRRTAMGPTHRLQLSEDGTPITEEISERGPLQS